MRHLSIFLAVLTFAKPAIACDNSPDVSQLPGESERDLKLREERTAREWFVVQDYLREEHAFKRASRVYLARVSKSRILTEEPLIMEAAVQPILAAKGRLPDAKQSLKQTFMAACIEFGDGKGANAPIGTLLFVFTGLPKSAERPNGIENIRATDARTFELLEALRIYGLNRRASTAASQPASR